jgi:hypothetical protein
MLANPLLLAGSVVATMAIALACSNSSGDASPTGADAAAAHGQEPPTNDGSSSDAPGPKDGGDAGSTWTVLATAFRDLAGLAVTETTVYFTERARGIVHSMPIAGGLAADVRVRK